MITKIEHIKGISNFEDYSAHGNVQLMPCTIIYADNGSGKTTLSEIFRSMSNGDEALINNRKRINCDLDPSVQIQTDGGTHIFSKKWNRLYPNMHIFNTVFVNENVYSGFEFGTDQKRHLYKFVLGDNVVLYDQRIKKVKDAIEAAKTNLTIKKQVILAGTPYQDPSQIINITEDTDINQKIASKEKELAAAVNNDVIQKHETLNLLPEIKLSLDLKELENILSISIDTIEKHFLEQVESIKTKLHEHGVENEEEWLYSGLNAIESEDDVCPFCGQSILNNALVKSYTQYFNTEYKELVQKIRLFYEKSKQVDINQLVSSLISKYSQLLESYQFWAQYISELPSLNKLIDSLDGLKLLWKKIVEDIEKKQENPTMAIVSINIHLIIDDIIRIDEWRSSLNEVINSINTKILAFKSTVKAKADIESELALLKLQKKRYESPMKEKCEEYLHAKKTVERLNSINTELQRRVKIASNTIFSTYGTTINDLLKNDFGTKFKIKDTKDAGYKGGSREPSIGYTLTFDGTPLSFSDGDSNAIKYTLSEGDKNTIAFCFFLAKIKQDPDLCHKTIIFDDPMTSLDMNRYNTTVDILVRLKPQCEQLVILSHHIHFLLEFDNRKGIRKSEKKYLQIENILGKSKLLEFQMKKEWIQKYQSYLNTIIDFRDNPDSTKMEKTIAALRMALELFLKFKFCIYVEQNCEFGKAIRALEANSNCMFADSDKANVIADLNSINEISWRAHHAQMDDPETYTEKNITLNELYDVYVPKSLSLLMNRL